MWIEKGLEFRVDGMSEKGVYVVLGFVMDKVGGIFFGKVWG